MQESHHAHEHSGHRVQAASVTLNRLALAATAHCLAGCAIGEVLGLVIGLALGLGNASSIALAVTLAFVFGYAFTLRPLLAGAVPFRRALSLALASDTLSITVAGDFFVDSTCINCDTCRQLALATFQEKGDYSSVYSQPETEPERQDAWRALLACPVGSIGTVEKDKAHLRRAMESFPLHLEGDVYYNGFNSEKSFGANS